jgi:hypothetical protein
MASAQTEEPEITFLFLTLTGWRKSVESSFVVTAPQLHPSHMGEGNGKPIGGQKALTGVVKKQATIQGVAFAATRGLLLVRLKGGSVAGFWGKGNRKVTAHCGETATLFVP